MWVLTFIFIIKCQLRNCAPLIFQSVLRFSPSVLSNSSIVLEFMVFLSVFEICVTSFTMRIVVSASMLNRPVTVYLKIVIFYSGCVKILTSFLLEQIF